MQLHEGTAQNIAIAIRAACEALHQADSALDSNQRMLRSDVRSAFKLVQVHMLC